MSIFSNDILTNMKIKILLITIVGIAWYQIFNFGLSLINKPNDFLLYAGILICLSIQIIVTSIIKKIIHYKRRENEKASDNSFITK